MTDAVQRLSQIRARIAQAEGAASRPVGAVELVAVSKTFDADAIRPALAAGQRVFGENKVQEAKGKWPVLRDEHDGIVLHLIGPLQSNKAGEAVALFDVIETVDREKIARELAKEMDKQGRRPRLYVQVNIGEEPQKAGIAPGEAVTFVTQLQRDYGLEVEGLMCIPPADADPAPFFRQLAALAREAGVDKLSMGMSGDFEAAITEGATSVRVGSAIFGTR